MAQLTLDQVYVPITDPTQGGGTIEVTGADVDVYESNADSQPAGSGSMINTQTLTAPGIYVYNQPAKFILFASAGAAVVRENGVVKLT